MKRLSPPWDETRTGSPETSQVAGRRRSDRDGEAERERGRRPARAEEPARHQQCGGEDEPHASAFGRLSAKSPERRPGERPVAPAVGPERPRDGEEGERDQEGVERRLEQDRLVEDHRARERQERGPRERRRPAEPRARGGVEQPDRSRAGEDLQDLRGDQRAAGERERQRRGSTRTAGPGRRARRPSPLAAPRLPAATLRASSTYTPLSRRPTGCSSGWSWSWYATTARTTRARPRTASVQRLESIERPSAAFVLGLPIGPSSSRSSNRKIPRGEVLEWLNRADC